MGEKLSWNYVAQAANGPSLSAAGEMEVDAYENLAITVADNASQQVDLVPNAKASLLFINPENASTDLTYKVGANDIQLDGPQVFIGAGAVALLGGATNLTNTNLTGADAVIEILVGRDATPKQQPQKKNPNPKPKPNPTKKTKRCR